MSVVAMTSNAAFKVNNLNKNSLALTCFVELLFAPD